MDLEYKTINLHHLIDIILCQLGGKHPPIASQCISSDSQCRSVPCSDLVDSIPGTEMMTFWLPQVAEAWKSASKQALTMLCWPKFQTGNDDS